MGELPEMIADGRQEALMDYVTSVNIACGGHAGDEQTMRATVEQAIRHGVKIGAHPSYPDRANFGRLELVIHDAALERSIFNQVALLASMAESAGGRLAHVKPHGALYNRAARDGALARTIAQAVARFSQDVVMVGLAGSRMLEVFREAGFRVAREAFADRRYEPDGTLRSRKFGDALIRDPCEAASQALGIAKAGSADTICIHGDTPGALSIAAAVARCLRGGE